MYVREDRIVNWEGKGVGGRGDAQPRTPFSIAVQYPNWLGQQSQWGPHETVKPQNGNPPFLEWHTPQTRRRKVLQIRKYQKPVFLYRFLDACGR